MQLLQFPAPSTRPLSPHPIVCGLFTWEFHIGAQADVPKQITMQDDYQRMAFASLTMHAQYTILSKYLVPTSHSVTTLRECHFLVAL